MMPPEPGADGRLGNLADSQAGSRMSHLDDLTRCDARPWVAIQRNPMSGSGKQTGLLLDLVRQLRRVGLRPRLYSSREALDTDVRDAVRGAGLKAIVAAGGDGTLLDLLNRHPDVPIVPFPLGTENLVARHLGLERCGRAVAELIAAGETRTFDAGRLNGRRFLVVASIGFDAAVLHRTHAGRRGHISHWAYAMPIVNELYLFDPPVLRVSVDDQPAVEGHVVVVGNLPRYALNLPLVPAADGHDGLLDIRVIPAGGSIELFRQFAGVLLEGVGAGEGWSAGHRLRGRRIRIESDRPVPVQADGDPAGTTPVEIIVEPAAVRLLVRGSEVVAHR